MENSARLHSASLASLTSGCSPQQFDSFLTSLKRIHAGAHTIHVWYIYLGLLDFYGKGR